jgi:hypothetical protein
MLCRKITRLRERWLLAVDNDVEAKLIWVDGVEAELWLLLQLDTLCARASCRVDICSAGT